MALGAVVRAASVLDQTLRTLYCALVGSKYAVITASGQMTSWLLEETRAVVAVRRDLSDAQRGQLASSLETASGLAKQRNRCVHDLWVVTATGPELMQGRRRQHDLTSEPVSLDDLISTARALTDCGVEISVWIARELGREARAAEVQLRWEDYLAAMPEEEVKAMLQLRLGTNET